MDTCQALAARYQADPGFRAKIIGRGTTAKVKGQVLGIDEMMQLAVECAAVSYVASGSTSETRKARRNNRKARRADFAAHASEKFGITIKPKWVELGAVGIFIVALFGPAALLLIVLGWAFEQMLNDGDENPQAFDQLCCSIAGAA